MKWYSYSKVTIGLSSIFGAKHLGLDITSKR
jgi:hypothetical protein